MHLRSVTSTFQSKFVDAVSSDTFGSGEEKVGSGEEKVGSGEEKVGSGEEAVEPADEQPVNASKIAKDPKTVVLSFMVFPSSIFTKDRNLAPFEFMVRGEKN